MLYSQCLSAEHSQIKYNASTPIQFQVLFRVGVPSSNMIIFRGLHIKYDCFGILEVSQFKYDYFEVSLVQIE